MKLAEALLRRKELQEKVDQLKPILKADIYRDVLERIQVTDSIEEVRGKVALLKISQVTAEHDHYASQLRHIDGIIQKANWETDVDAEKYCENYKHEE